MARRNKALAVVQGPKVRADQAIDLRRDRSSGVVVSVGGRDQGPVIADQHRTLRRDMVEVDGKQVKATRNVDVLKQKHAAGDITNAMYKAGIKFQVDFDTGAWDAMPGSRYDGMPRSGGSPGSVSLQVVDARTETLKAIDALGGFGSPCAVAVWWIVGQRWSISQLAGQPDKNMGISRHETLTGTLLGGLGVLAVHYNYASTEKHA